MSVVIMDTTHTYVSSHYGYDTILMSLVMDTTQDTYVSSPYG